ncbi:DNA-directed RNA polymerase subunit D [Halobellus salinus]|uniref:DNA-directed RNA polymerase subunit Rpo3 n=1 Tax=Halobellus salinus TaxID=931585 RepID=A0A830EJN3_9EURY|nr:DNA-directed RNA polymerase subunit D [Halobellus salinus]GGI97833.1 DNA-directed RNA polymerase subunit D [Halobellus salinus]SMP06878.1 DNA-directed RNA polymerase, subunit D [Halobellus salinus]
MTNDFEVEFIEPGERSARFLVRGVSPAVANGIRRAMVADVPTFSIDTVRFVENSSVMFDEMIGLRLGLVPLSTPIGDFEEGDVVTLALDVEGPATAYSGDLESADAMVQPADENIPIIELKDGQHLEFEADAVLDSGKSHAKHQGGVSVGYRHLQRVEVAGDAGEFEEQEPNILRGVIEEAAAEHADADADATDGDLVATDAFDNDLTNRYPGKEVEVHDVPDAFVFHVETDGSFSVEELVLRAAETLGDRAAELESKVAI